MDIWARGKLGALCAVCPLGLDESIFRFVRFAVLKFFTPLCHLVRFTAAFNPARLRGRSGAERGNGCRGWRGRPVRELTPEFGVREFEVLF